MVVCAWNPNHQEADTGGSLGPTLAYLADERSCIRKGKGKTGGQSLHVFSALVAQIVCTLNKLLNILIKSPTSPPSG